MPRFDGTGPAGAGPMTGRGLGSCGAGYGYGRGLGRGFGRGIGRGMGWRMAAGVCPWYAQPTELSKEDEKKLLKEDIEMLKEELAQTQKDLQNLETK